MPLTAPKDSPGQKNAPVATCNRFRKSGSESFTDSHEHRQNARSFFPGYPLQQRAGQSGSINSCIRVASLGPPLQTV